MGYKEKRKAARYPLRINVHYERILPDGAFDIPMSVPVRDLGLGGISFFSEEKLEINSLVRVKILVARDESITFEGRTVRVMISDRKEIHYIVGVSVEDIASSDLEKLKNFLVKVDINNVLDGIDLENVVDIHLVSGYAPIKKKLGKLIVEEGEPFDEYILKYLLLAMLDGDRYIKFMRNKEFNFVLTTRKGRRFRVNLHIQQGKIEGAFRVIPAQIDAPSSLGLPVSVENLLLNKSGLILVSGRTGSGKTTTLASMIEFINNKRSGIIVCIEEPIEYVYVNRHCIIKQREVGRDTLSFSNAAKNALRQNPDILVVGEILDMETMETAITAAETGALVLTSIHAGDAVQALDRVSSFFPGDIQKHILKRLSLVLKGVISQDLIPRIDETGLVLSTEIMVVTSAVRRVIREADWKQIPSLIQVGKNVGMQTMQSSLRELYNRGLIDLEYMADEMI
ncbi:MAG: PilT/PilU family type 4a pilus ATPase [Candidatus Omnitrophica bacterium]|nr:PilT/PilU family type 4a pilus ATPase [Candidatus Omnitrophota bacterium]